MITEIFAENCKGMSFTQKVSGKTLFFGRNRCGKTARTIALQIAVLGYVQINGTAYKKPADILDAFGMGNSLHVGFKVDDWPFERRFKRSKKGVVTQTYYAQGKKVKKDKFMSTLGSVGMPKIFDLMEFMKLSDQKKIDHIFELFPPEGDIQKLEEEIESLNDKKNSLAEDAKTKKAVIATLESDKADIELPAGSLSEVQAEIENLTEKVNKGNAEIAEEEARIKAESELKEKEERIKKEAAEKAVKEEQEKVAAEKRYADEQEEELKKGLDAGKKNTDAFLEDNPPKTDEELEQMPFVSDKMIQETEKLEKKNESMGISPKVMDAIPYVSIQNIIDVIDASGCEVCAAKMIAVRERHNYDKPEGGQGGFCG